MPAAASTPNMGNTFKTATTVLAKSSRLFLLHDPLVMAGATAFFTMFALPPILIILVQVFSLFIDPHTIRHELFTSLAEIFGQESARQVIAVIRAVRKLSGNLPATILLYIFLLFVATTVFKIMRSSIDKIWAVEVHPGRKIIASLQSRLQSLLVIFLTGLLFSAGIFIETVEVVIGNYFFKIFPALSAFFNQSLAFIISVFIQAAWFTIIFRYVNGSRPRWRIAWAGGIFTSVLFSFGKMILHWLLTYNNINNIYGASASIVLLLLFVFYSAMILYFGAAFTKVWDEKGVGEAA